MIAKVIKSTSKIPIVAAFSKLPCKTIGKALDFTLSHFPNTVRIETTNDCNGKCTICPHSMMERAIKPMDDNLFIQIIDECAQNNCKEIHMHNFGEPLLDQSLENKVQYAKKKGIGKVKIFSNGSLMTPKRAIRLMDSGLDEIKISFDGATKEEFERIRFPLNFETIVKNIKELVRIRNSKKSNLKIYITCCSTSNKTGTMTLLKNMVDGFSFDKVHNWSDKHYTSTESKIRKPCSRVWRTFTILSNGDVSLCCLDYDGKIILGTINNDTSISDIWRGSYYEMIRNLHKNAQQNEISICNNCTKSFL